MTNQRPGLLTLTLQNFAADAARALEFLDEQGTFHFPTLNTGLFSAAVGDGTDFEHTGYRSVWVRDNVHIAHAHWVWGDTTKAVNATAALMKFFVNHHFRFRDIITERTSPDDPMERPHIRFDGQRLEELSEKWSHAQNDALGGFLWLYSKLARHGHLVPTRDEFDLISDVIHYFRVVRFWEDEDSGHWEETRKVAASSIGVATAGLLECLGWIQSESRESTKDIVSSEVIESCKGLIEKGASTLASILPWECRQEAAHLARRFDSALLFLIYPYGIVATHSADEIASDVRTNLMGQHGIRRYLGDSYWCADYKDKLSASVRTSDFSDNLAERNRLLEPGTEAQWCLFDPILSIHFGLRHERTGDAEDRHLQLEHLNRSFSQLTKLGSRFGDYRCPESYYYEHGTYVPNDICPLLWTQANLKLALWFASGHPVKR
ncbi:MAG: phosphorylase kinase [Planctomycetes bacterium]|nr:phosphorylase kinase [Planctomycetota bacterium]